MDLGTKGFQEAFPTLSTNPSSFARTLEAKLKAIPAKDRATDFTSFKVTYSDAKATMGQLTVLSVPSGAAVLIDDVFKGYTPKKLIWLESGEHRLILRKSGYKDFHAQVTVEANVVKEVNIDLASSRLISPNTPPVAAFSFSPIKPHVGDRVTFDATNSYDPDGIIKIYQWSFGDGSTGSGKITTHVYNRSGAFTVTLTVTDDKGATATASKKITVTEANQSPKADFTYSPQQPTDLDTIQFTDKSTDPDGQITEWHWDFGDGTTSTEQHPSHQYQDDDTYTATLTVTDNDGAKATADKMITVSNVPPEVEFTFSPEEPQTEEVITFNACDSQDRDGTIERYEWDWDGDGEYDTSKASCKIEHSFSKAGEYKVILRITDDDGATAQASRTLSVAARNRPPKADFSYEPDKPTDLDTIQFTDKSTDPDGQIVKWQWDFGDGTTSAEQNPSHQYDDDGAYTVTLTVTDNGGATDTTSKEIHIANVSPHAKFSFSPESPTTQDTVQFADRSTDPDGQIVEWQWDFGDGTTSTEQNPTYQYQALGTYTVKLTVTDDDEATNSIEKEITVTAPAEKIKDRYAIVIGVSDYLNATEETCPPFCDLKYPDKDAQAFYDLLVDPNVGNFPEDHVTLLLNDQATDAAIRGAFGKLIGLAEEDDLVLIYYSGHGGQGPDLDGDDGDGTDEYYIPYDVDPSNLFGTAIRDDEFGNWMNTLRSQHVAIFLDSCFSGGATRKIKGFTPPGYKANPNNSVFNDFSFEDRVLIAASQENQPSFESDELKHGVFTYYLLEALQGKADANGDGQIVADEVYQYVKPKVKEYVSEHWPGYVQTPLEKGTIDPALISKEEAKLEGAITAIVGGKEKAGLNDQVLISLGRQDGVQIGDIFEVYHEYVSKGVMVEERRGKVEVTDFVGEDRSLGKVVESLVPIEVGDKVRRIEE